MKQITIIGATAGVGLECVKQALAQGHRVVTLSRGVPGIPANERLTVLQGSATNAADIKQAIAGSDAVIVAIGTGASMKATTLYTDAAKAMTEAIANPQLPVIVLTGFGAGESGAYQSFLMTIMFSLLLKKVYQNKTEMEQMITASPLNWEIVRPARLTDKPLTGQYQMYTSLTKGMKMSSIPRADVAHFLVGQAVNPTQLGQYVSLTS